MFLFKVMNLEDNYEEKPIDIHAKPMILYFDSFGQLDKNFPIPIRKYLELEFMDKKPEDYAKIQSKWKGIDENLLPCFQPLVLFQDNLKDCGIFVLEYTESFLNNPDFILANIEVY
jgi:Ulp1 family protease